jgi:hypothetical protein
VSEMAISMRMVQQRKRSDAIRVWHAVRESRAIME